MVFITYALGQFARKWWRAPSVFFQAAQTSAQQALADFKHLSDQSTYATMTESSCTPAMRLMRQSPDGFDRLNAKHMHGIECSVRAGDEMEERIREKDGQGMRRYKLGTGCDRDGKPWRNTIGMIIGIECSGGAMIREGLNG